MGIIQNVTIIIRDKMTEKVHLEVKNISKFFIKGDNYGVQRLNVRELCAVHDETL